MVYTGLCDMQDNLNTQIKNSVDTINKYGEELVQINKQIMRAEAGKVEHANDLRDRRNYILDELSKMGKISYEEDMYGAVTVQFEGVDFVKTESYNKMEVYADRETGFYTPIGLSWLTMKQLPGGRGFRFWNRQRYMIRRRKSVLL